jgi:hypothetical protein
MKLSGLLIAVAAGTLFAAPVLADRHVEVQRTVVTHTDNGWHGGRHIRRHKVCRTRWVHHRRVTRCYWR